MALWLQILLWTVGIIATGAVVAFLWICYWLAKDKAEGKNPFA